MRDIINGSAYWTKQTFEQRMTRQDGSGMTVEISIFAPAPFNGDLIVVTHRDISLNKHAGITMQNEALLNAIPDLLFIFDQCCKITDIYCGSLNRVQIDPDLYLGKTVEEIFPLKVAAITQQKVTAVLTSRTPALSTYELQVDDELKSLELRYVPYRTNEVLLIISDITGQERAEQLQNAPIESYLDVFNSIAEGIYILDESGTFIDVNEGAEKMYQSSRDELIGRTLLSIGAPGKNDLDEIKNCLSKVSETGEAASFNFQGIRRNGEIFSNEMYVNKGKCLNKSVLILTARNIVDKNQAEEQILSKNEELQKSNAEKDKFFSIMTHDLRSPFASFLGLTQMLVQELPNQKLDNIQEIALMMRESATNLHHLLESLLQWSRLHRGMILYNPRHFELWGKVNNSLESVMEIASNKGIEVSSIVPEEIVIYADENMLESAIRNIATNAVKFTGKGGKVLISANNNELGDVEISIKDTGIGMSPEILGKLFRIDELNCRPGTNGEPSTGLGLILCKDFMDKHNGKIRVESTEGIGSVFHLMFPNKNGGKSDLY